jgi:hypothetical protein
LQCFKATDGRSPGLRSLCFSIRFCCDLQGCNMVMATIEAYRYAFFFNWNDSESLWSPFYWEPSRNILNSIILLISF